MLTHENVVSNASSVLLQLGDEKPNNTDVMISFLPLAHMLERISHVGVFMGGGAVGFFSGNIANFLDDMMALKPTISPAVPRLFNRIYDKVQSGLGNSALKRFLFNLALTSKENELRRGIIRSNTIWDKLVLRKVKDAMGGRIRLIIVGSAPLAGTVMTFMRCARGCIILESYGLTECAAPTTLSVHVRRNDTKLISPNCLENNYLKKKKKKILSREIILQSMSVHHSHAAQLN